MRSELGRRHARAFRSAVEADAQAHLRNRAVRSLATVDESRLAQHGIVGKLVEPMDRACRDARARKEVEPVRARPAAQ